MDALTIEGIAGYNGDYPLDMTYFTNRELHLIKEVSGVRAGELEEAFAAGDNDLMVAIAAIMIWRKTGTKPNLDALWDAEAGKFTFNMEDSEDEPEDDDSLPPKIAPDDAGSTSEPSPEDGATLNGSTESPESVLSRIGAQG